MAAALLAMLLVGRAEVDAQDAASTAEPTAEVTAGATQLDIFQDFYNSPSGWHAQIPPGWTTTSSTVQGIDYARFTLDDQSIYVFGYDNTSEDNAVANALVAAGLHLSVDPIDTRSVNLINGTWVQRLYVDGDQRVVAHTQNFDGTQYVIMFVGSTAAVPVIVTGEGAADTRMIVRQKMGDAAQLALPGVTVDPPSDNAFATFDQERVVMPTQTYAAALNGADVTVIGDARGDTVFTVAGTGDLAALYATWHYFDTLSLFFITPRTGPYLLLGLALAGTLFALLILSLIVRSRNLRKDEATLKALDT